MQQLPGRLMVGQSAPADLLWFMYYTYVLRSLKNGRFYVGHTEDLTRRLQQHNAGEGGRFTSQNRPFEIVYFEEQSTRSVAMHREKYLKSGTGRQFVKLFLLEKKTNLG
jgi:putative endonuclease